VVDVVLAGEVGQDVRPLLRQPWVERLLLAGRIRLLDRYIDLAEEHLLFAAVDIVWLGYVGHYTGSAVLEQAAASGRPVIACEDGLIGWETQRHSLGKVITPGSTPEIVAAVHAFEREWKAGSVPAVQKKEANTIARAQRVLVSSLLLDGE
jgi:hypothetical protein